MNDSDRILINFVEKEINAGKKEVIISQYMLANVNEEALIEIRRLCKSNNVELRIEG